MQELKKYLHNFVRYNISWKNITTIKSKDMFSEKEWNKIFPDLSSFKEIEVFLSKGYGQCMIANTLTGESFAFVFLYCENERDKKISFHGGGWLKNNSIQHYVATMALIEELFASGYKVRTSCLVNNDVAFRFLHSLGFIKYRSTDHYHYMWLPYKRFINTPIYKRIKKY